MRTIHLAITNAAHWLHTVIVCVHHIEMIPVHFLMGLL
jgi:hypothetical protein